MFFMYTGICAWSNADMISFHPMELNAFLMSRLIATQNLLDGKFISEKVVPINFCTASSVDFCLEKPNWFWDRPPALAMCSSNLATNRD